MTRRQCRRPRVATSVTIFICEIQRHSMSPHTSPTQAMNGVKDRNSYRLLRNITPPSGRDQPAQHPAADAPTLGDGDPARGGHWVLSRFSLRVVTKSLPEAPVAVPLTFRRGDCRINTQLPQIGGTTDRLAIHFPEQRLLLNHFLTGRS